MLYPYPEVCEVELPVYLPTSEYQVELLVTDYVINALLYSLQGSDLLSVAISNN